MRRTLRGGSREWTDDAQSDPGITLLELLAYLADRLSYYQDEIAAEARLKTRRRYASALLVIAALVAWRCRGAIKRHVDRCRSEQ